MNVKEFYDVIDGDYESVMARFPSEEFAKKFLVKFLSDPAFELLRSSVAENNISEAFRASHTLKGLCLTFGFTRLYEVNDVILEALRPLKETEGLNEMFKNVEEVYEQTVSLIKNID